MPNRHLSDNRGRLLAPHKLADSMQRWLVDMATLFHAVGRQLGDERWHGIAEELDAAAVRLRALY